MALIVGTPYSGTGTPFTLAAGDHFILQPGVLIYSTNGDAVSSSNGGHRFDIYGKIIGAQGIKMGDSDDDFGNTLTIYATGSVSSLSTGDDAIDIRGGQSKVINYGLISGNYGIDLFSDSGTGSSVTNYGTITTQAFAISNNGLEKITVVNKGTITSYASVAVYGGGGADLVTNTGTINGDVRLSGGSDIFEGKGGRVKGSVFGGAEKDSLRGGSFVDKLDGEGGDDAITGRGGKDILTGGTGADHFYYYAVSELGDTITDFTTADFFHFKSSAFGNATVGTCTAANFWSNTTGLAHDPSDRFIYDTKQDRLWFDKDGTGPAKPVLVTDFAYDVALTRADIIIFA